MVEKTKKERGREKRRECVHVSVWHNVRKSVCVCEREKLRQTEKERDREREGERERERS
jgi:hypothetical protein